MAVVANTCTGTDVVLVLPTYISVHGSYFAHLSFSSIFIICTEYHRRSCLKREFGYIPNPDRHGVILGKPWVLHGPSTF